MTPVAVPPSLPPPPPPPPPPLLEVLLLLLDPQAARTRARQATPATNKPRAGRLSKLAMQSFLLTRDAARAHARANWRGTYCVCVIAALSRRPPLQLHRLDGEELLEAEAAQFPAVAGLLVAAERRQRVEGAAVDLDLAGAQPPGHGLGVLLVA